MIASKEIRHIIVLDKETVIGLYQSYRKVSYKSISGYDAAASIYQVHAKYEVNVMRVIYTNI